jgi:hypothetical protein
MAISITDIPVLTVHPKSLMYESTLATTAMGVVAVLIVSVRLHRLPPLHPKYSLRQDHYAFSSIPINASSMTW